MTSKEEVASAEAALVNEVQLRRGPHRRRRRMPAEWEPHAACLLLCPHNAATFRLDLVQPQFWQVVYSIAKLGQEDVILYCKDQEQCDEYRSKVVNLDNDDADDDDDDDATRRRIHCHVCDSNDSWARDTGPTFVLVSTGEEDEEDKHDRNVNNTKLSLTLEALDWDFNAYGGPDEGCYWPCEQDKQVAASMVQILKDKDQKKNDDGDDLTRMIIPDSTTIRSIPLILEGGSIHTDGQGTILTTAECLLNPNRNPDKKKHEIEIMVLEATGCTKMIWLDYGLAGDEDTNGHVDNWCCFIKPGHVVLAWTDDAVHHAENYQRCRHSLAQLESITDATGRSLVVHKLYLPSPMFYSQREVDSLNVIPTPIPNNPAVVQPRQAGEPMAASYVNFYIANRAVIVPQYGDPVFDAKALETLRPLFAPERAVVGVPSREILIGGGNIHCITQQVPLVPS